MRNTNRSEGVVEGVAGQATGRGNSMTSAPQPPDIIPLKELEKHAILVAVRLFLSRCGSGAKEMILDLGSSGSSLIASRNRRQTEGCPMDCCRHARIAG